MTGLKMLYADAATGAVYPDAVWAISHAKVDQDIGAVGFTINVYATDQTMAAGLQPLTKQLVTLTPAEVQSQITPLASVLYSILLARPAFATATFIP